MVWLLTLIQSGCILLSCKILAQLGLSFIRIQLLGRVCRTDFVEMPMPNVIQQAPDHVCVPLDRLLL